MKGQNDPLFWQTLERKRVYNGKIFDICQVERQSTAGQKGEFVEVNAPQWTTVLPWFRSEEGIPSFVMVRQYRHGSNTVVTEFPAGTVDPNETPYEAALRELEEETGYVPAGKVTKLGSVSPNPAFMTNRVYFYLVEGLFDKKKQKLDENEQLEIIIMPVEKVLNLMGTKEFDNGIMMIAQAYFVRYAQTNLYLLN